VWESKGSIFKTLKFIATLRVGSLKMSQIFASRFGGQNLVQTIDFFKKKYHNQIGLHFQNQVL